MLSESRRKKLEMLTRSLAAGDIQAAQKILQAQTGRPGTKNKDAAAPTHTFPPGEALPLELAVPGVETLARPGKYWLVRRTLAEVSADYAGISRQYAAVLRGARQRFDELEASAGFCHAANSPPEGPLFMDIETCGLAGACIFLVGIMSFQDEQLVFEQFLARHYGEEAAILDVFAARLQSAGVLITFNGKSFDMTMIRERGAFHGIDLAFEPPHCDLLHESRKRWRRALPNCRLQTLEQYMCKRRRVGDIPGAEIPAAYHRFVATGDARQLAAILHHNLLDLLTMSQLLCSLLAGENPESQP